MKLQVFAVYDTAAQVYMRPFFVRTVGEALRLFGDISNDPNTPVGAHPADYNLMHLGDWDDDSALFGESLGTNMGKALDFVKAPPASLFDKEN